MDYVFGSLVIGPLLLLSLGGVALLYPFTTRWLSDYHVLADVALALLFYGLLSALALRLLLKLRPIPPGEHDLESATFAHWKLLTITYRLGQGALSPLLPFFLRPLLEVLFGARVGADAACGGKIDDPYQVSIGAGTVLGDGSLVSGNYVSGGKLHCGPVRIGRGVTIGANTIVLPSVEIGDGATVMSGACVMPGTVVPAGETWRGNPARKWL